MSEGGRGDFKKKELDFQKKREEFQRQKGATIKQQEFQSKLSTFV